MDSTFKIPFGGGSAHPLSNLLLTQLFHKPCRHLPSPLKVGVGRQHQQPSLDGAHMPWGSNSDSEVLVWGLRFCIPDKLPANGKAVALWTPSV